MFYSHEILTSPEHGVATIWLVATLGSRSITRKLNRKTILEVDVPKACDVITNPDAPMALRLQGSLLYGVSRVYNQQCGYTLMDVQTMHDRMKSILKVIHGAGIDPSAGKAKPDQLILPYDPTFLPEINLPNLDLDLSKFDLQPEISAGAQGSSFLWTKSPETSLPALSSAPSGNLQLDIPSDDLMHIAAPGSETDIASFVQRTGHLGRALGLDFGDEEGVLLRADFEFDEDGNIVELGERRPSEREVDGRRRTETPIAGAEVNGGQPFAWDDPALIMDEEMQAALDNNGPLDANVTEQKLPVSGLLNDEDNISEYREVRVRQTLKKAKTMLADTRIALRNTDLAQWNNEYLQNMAVASKQKQQNKIPTLSKRNAAFWVLGRGIGSVGIGLGTSREPHPLKHFSGDDLYASLSPDGKPRGRKRGRPRDSDSESEQRRVRAREDEDQIGRGGLQGEIIMQDDPEIGRHAPSSVHDDQSSQMPWNITASIQSSRHGSSAQPFRGLGSVDNPSSRGLSDQDAMGLGLRSRLTSASPLAGRCFPFDLDNLSMLGHEGELGDLDLDLYLQSELDPDRHTVSAEAEGSGMISAPRRGNTEVPQKRVTESGTLDQESLNFLEFLNAKAEPASAVENDEDVEADAEASSDDHPHLHSKTDTSDITFSALLPSRKTSRVVATHALMHVLTLATKGLLTIRQEPYVIDESSEFGSEYRGGEIFLRLRNT